MNLVVALNSDYTPPCGARPPGLPRRCLKSDISTHTPLAGRDSPSFLLFFCKLKFLLTRPLRGATSNQPQQIKIKEDFYSHAPCGARLFYFTYWRNIYAFLLTRPLRGATLYWCAVFSTKSDFYSHAPCGARPVSTVICGKFLLTRPLRGATRRRLICFHQ